MSCEPKQIQRGSIETIKVLATGKVNGQYIDLPNNATNLELWIVDADADPLLPGNALVLAGTWEQMGRNYWATAIVDTTPFVLGDYDVYIRFNYGSEYPLLPADNLLSVV